MGQAAPVPATQPVPSEPERVRRVHNIDHVARLRRLAVRRASLDAETSATAAAAVAAGMSQAAVARLLGVSRQAVWERLHRAN